MNWKTTFLAAVAICGLALPNLAAAQNIKGPAQITASATIPQYDRFVISEIADGDITDVAPFQGFAGTNDSLGTISLALDRPYNLTTFHLSNDINLADQGVTQFTLKFFDAANIQIGAVQTFNAALSTFAQQDFLIGTVANVAKVEMGIDAVSRRVEIREVSFTGQPTRRVSSSSGVGNVGTPIELDPPPQGTTCPGPGCLGDTSTCCPPSATFPLGNLFKLQQQGVGNPYYYDFAAPTYEQGQFTALNTQMIAYLNYLRVLDPAYQGFAMTFRIFNGGTGPTAVAGAQMGTDSQVYWNAGATTGALWPNSTFFGPTTKVPANNWVVIEMILWTQGPGRPYAQSCEKRYITTRQQVGARRAGPGAGGDFISYAGPAPASAARQPAQRR